ncbi:MAG TPA: hypothetical protein VF164_09685 [Trueperaceae bacterium]
MRTRAGIGRQVPLFLALLALTACGGPQGPSGPNPPGEGSAVLGPDTKVLDDAALAALISVSQDGELTFEGAGASSLSLEVGDVLLAGVSPSTPQGALRRVEDVDPGPSGVVVKTSQATLVEAFQELHLDLQKTIAPETQTEGVAPQADGISFPFDLVEPGEGGNVELSGAISLAPSFDLDFDIDIASFQVDELTMEFGADQTLLAELSGSGQASFGETVQLGAIPFAPISLVIPTPAGPIPLILTPAVAVEVGLAGSVAGSFQASVNQEASFTAGVGYQDGEAGGFWDGDSELQFEQPTYGAAVSVEASAGPRLEVLLYGAVGPYASVSGVVRANATVEGPPICTRGVLDAGLTAKAGLDLVLDDFDTTLLDEVVPVASFDSCSDDPNAPRPAATWARSLSRIGSTGEDAAAVAEAPDGSYLIVGNSSLFDGITGFGAALWAVRLDPVGNVVWQRAYSGLVTGGVAQAAIATPDGFVIATLTGLIKLDTGGNVMWGRTYSTAEPIAIASIAPAADGGIVLAGTQGLTSKAWAAKADEHGDVIWSRTFAGDDFAGVAALADGGHALVGTIGSNDGDAYVVRLDAAGDVAWERAVDDEYDLNGGDGDPLFQSATDGGFDVAELHGGGLVVVGYSYGAFPNPEPDPTGHFEAWVVELTAGGDLVSSTVHRAPSTATNDVAQAVVVKDDGGVVTLGMRADDASDLFESEDVLVVQGSAYKAFGGSGNDTLNTDSGASASDAALATSDGGLIVAATSDTFSGENELWVLKLGRTANIDFPYDKNPAGSSFENPDANSLETGSGGTDVALTSTSIGAIQVESTPVSGDWQAP